ncbi:MAG: hypothetical protein I4O49_22995 [Janthinobacterium lividum]|nr:hypothetical protein [Janthinobacterium lividum]
MENFLRLVRALSCRHRLTNIELLCEAAPQHAALAAMPADTAFPNKPAEILIGATALVQLPGRHRKGSANLVFAPLIDENALLVTNGQADYRAFAHEAEIKQQAANLRFGIHMQE